MVNGYQDLVMDKLLAFFGRWTHRDTVDLYLILQDEDSDELFRKARRKDPGFDLYWLAVALKQVETFPDHIEEWDVSMLVPVDLAHLRKTASRLANEILDSISGGRSNDRPPDQCSRAM